MYELANMRPRERAYVILDMDEGDVVAIGFAAARGPKLAARRFQKVNPDASKGIQAMLYSEADPHLLEQARDAEADAGGG